MNQFCFDVGAALRIRSSVNAIREAVSNCSLSRNVVQLRKNTKQNIKTFEIRNVLKGKSLKRRLHAVWYHAIFGPRIIFNVKEFTPEFDNNENYSRRIKFMLIHEQKNVWALNLIKFNDFF